jgi:redox-sensitive bicupin YhaK (pirin superfamily)
MGPGLLVAAQPLGEPVARHGRYVMNTRDRIVLAVEDFRAGSLA